jgi:predicted transport protein
MENFERKERVSVDEYTIEHILPRSDDDASKLSAKWREALGLEWENIWTNYRHTLGNLTLTGYNSEYSNRPFAEKRDMVGGFKESPLRLNAGLGQLDTWDESAIKTRADKLAERATGVWSAPRLAPDILEAYHTNAPSAGYGIDDHPHLLSSAMRELFGSLRREVLALDPCVTEEFLKLYVAYKAETNFVDVVPQAKRLRLSINMKFADINDPRHICNDVSNLGRWGNGDVEVGLTSADDLPYVIGLIRQSLERQMGNGGDA